MLIKCIWGPTTTIFASHLAGLLPKLLRASWMEKRGRRGAKFRGSLKLAEPGCIDSCGRFKPWASSWWIKCSRFDLCFKLSSGWGLWSLPKWASENWGNFSTYFHPLTGMFPHKQLFSPCGMGVTGPQSGYATSIVRAIYSPRLEWRTRTDLQPEFLPLLTDNLTWY